MKIGRNDPCPCGSGKKYKNCCLKKTLVPLESEISLPEDIYKTKDINISLNKNLHIIDFRKFKTVKTSICPGCGAIHVHIRDKGINRYFRVSLLEEINTLQQIVKDF
jgi:hypothetical protein